MRQLLIACVAGVAASALALLAWGQAQRSPGLWEMTKHHDLAAIASASRSHTSAWDEQSVWRWFAYNAGVPHTSHD